MFFLEILSRIVTILVGLLTLTKKGVNYIKRWKEQTKKDPSACLPASDESDDDCISNR